MKSMNGTAVFKEVMRARREHAALGGTRAFMSGQGLYRELRRGVHALRSRRGAVWDH